MTNYEQYKEAMKAVESYRKEVHAAYNCGDVVMRQDRFNPDAKCYRFNGTEWRWDRYDYLVGGEAAELGVRK